MIIDSNYLLEFGLQISDEITEDKLARAIKTAEQYVIKPRLGYELYADIVEDPTAYETVLNGGLLVQDDKHIYVAGLKEAEAHIAFGILIAGDVNATAFGSVLKNDDYSTHADEDKLRRTGMMHTEIGMQYLKEITDYYKIDNTAKPLPNIWEELI